MTEINPINLPKLKRLIREGINAIPIDRVNPEAVIVIGDTGVGKSTILSFLNGSNLLVKFDGLKAILDNPEESRLKIGHQKFSETSLPTKLIIDKIAFFDCPGFKDNKGEEYEISNSFFIQRLLDLYKNVKILLVVDESHISEARADKLPKLIKNLHEAFKTFSDIQDGCLMVINRAGKQNTEKDYEIELEKLIEMKNEDGYLFDAEERKFVKFLIQSQKILIFRMAKKQNKNHIFKGGQSENKILRTIKQCNFVKSKHINNILSQSAKLAIRDFIDEITNRSNGKIEKICDRIVDIYSEKVRILGRNLNEIMNLKDEIINLAEEIKSAEKQNILNILQREVSSRYIQDFEEDFASVMFFKAIYDKTGAYFSNLINKIYSQLSTLLTTLDKEITFVQKEIQEENLKEKQMMELKIKQEQREKQKIVALEHAQRMQQLRETSKSMINSKLHAIKEIQTALRSLSLVEEQLHHVKEDLSNLQRMNRLIEEDFSKISEPHTFKSSIKN